MGLTVCSCCRTRVMIMADGSCPSCQHKMAVSTVISPPPPDVRKSGTVASIADLVPPRKSPPSSVADPQPSERILDSLGDPQPPSDSSLGYRCGILIASIVMLTLPIIYLGLMAVLGYATYLNSHIIVVIVAPIVILFMVKPLFRWARGQARPRVLSRDDEPLLFALVEKVCRVVRAPVPRRIELVCDVNASAGFRRGYFSLLTGGDLTLTIGVPLLAGLSVSQFAGVLAHEFGHFSQGAGMRLTYIIRRVNHWFARVVYERDGWDEKLWQIAGFLPFQITWIVYVAIFIVWLVRKLLWSLMMIGHLVSSFMLRRMEFDADSRETGLVGAETFESTVYRLAELNIASQGAMADLQMFYEEGRLCDNLPELIVENARRFSDEEVSQIREVVSKAKAGFFDTHPCDSDRIAASRSRSLQGSFQFDLPAKTLCKGFGALARQVTLDFYNARFDHQISDTELHAIEDLLARQRDEEACNDAANRFFAGTHELRRANLLLNQITRPEDPETTKARLLAARRKSSDLLQEIHAAQSGDDVKGESVREKIDQFHAASTERLLSALQMLFLPEIAAGLPENDRRKADCERLTPVLRKIDHSMDDWQSLRQGAARLDQLIHAFVGDQENEPLMARLQGEMGTVSRLVVSLRQALRKTDYPFDHAQGDISVGDFVLAQLPPGEDPIAVCHGAYALDSALSRLHLRLVGCLSELAEKTERELGLEPMAVPQPSPAERTPALV